MIGMLSVRDEGMVPMFRDNPPRQGRPRLLLAYSDSAHASRCVRYFRRLGWEVHMSASGNEAQRLACELAPSVVVLDADLPDESGWLSSAKITLAHPEEKVILLTSDLQDETRRRADTVGA